MGGRGASSNNINSTTVRKIVELENKKDSYNIRKYLQDNKVSLRADTERIIEEGITRVERTNAVGVFKNNIRIGTIKEKNGKWRKA